MGKKAIMWYCRKCQQVFACDSTDGNNFIYCFGRDEGCPLNGLCEKEPDVPVRFSTCPDCIEKARKNAYNVWGKNHYVHDGDPWP